jgi:prepilin-type N-terminal cleavage/methylation domain-containing protein
MRVRDEHGFTIVELVVVMIVSLIVMTGLMEIFVSGTRTASDAQARMAAQQNGRLALDRLEFEARCATSASIGGSGSSVSLVLPTWCSHGTGNVCWGVSAGVLKRYPSTTCSGSSLSYIRSVTSATPFSLQLATGDLPRLQVALTVNTTGRASDALTLTDTITLRNAARS